MKPCTPDILPELFPLLNQHAHKGPRRTRHCLSFPLSVALSGYSQIPSDLFWVDFVHLYGLLTQKAVGHADLQLPEIFCVVNAWSQNIQPH